MNEEPDKDKIQQIVSGKSSIPMKWIVLAILGFAVLYHAALLITGR